MKGQGEEKHGSDQGRKQVLVGEQTEGCNGERLFGEKKKIRTHFVGS